MIDSKAERPRAPRRARTAQFNVRQLPDVRDKFREAMARLEEVVHKAGGGKLTQAALVEYWSIWFADLDPESQAEWARAYRDSARARVDRIERRAAEARGFNGIDLRDVRPGTTVGPVAELRREAERKGKGAKRSGAPKG